MQGCFPAFIAAKKENLEWKNFFCKNSSFLNNIGGNMIPLNLWEHQNSIKTLYANCVKEVRIRHKITRMELDILLFLANNPCFDTAKEIVEIRCLSKSQVSASLKLMETYGWFKVKSKGKTGYVRKEYAGGNRKTVHLKICPAAADIVRDGKLAQKKFLEILLLGFSEEERETMGRFTSRIWENIHTYLKEEV